MTYATWRSEIAKALDQRLHPLEWLDWWVQNGPVLIWESSEAIIILELRQFPSGATELHALVGAGPPQEQAKLAEFAEDWGRQNGCIRISVSSKPGWARILKHRGYLPHQLTVVKEL